MTHRISRFFTALVWVAAFSHAILATAATTNKGSLRVVPDHANALYRVGEPAIFSVELAAGDPALENAEVRWAIAKDGGRAIKTGQLELVHGRGTVIGTLDEPGFLHCRVTVQTANRSSLIAVAGAGFEPEKIRPSLPVPDDFDAYWAGLKKKLAGIPMNPRLTPVTGAPAKVEAFDVQVDAIGAPVSGYLARPTGAKPRSLPIILTVHGAGVRSSILGTATGWAQQGFLAMDINAHGLPNGRPEKFYADLANGSLKDYRIRGRESRDTIYFQGMFLRLIRAIDFLTAQPEWNGRTVVVHGSSQGGAQSIVAAGLDLRVTFYAAGVPAMCDHTGVLVGRVNGWPQMVPLDAGGKPDANVVAAARYYDVMNFATRVKADGIVTVGFIDTTCPPTSVYAAYNALAGKKEIFNDPPSTHAVSAKAGAAMRQAILRHAGKL